MAYRPKIPSLEKVKEVMTAFKMEEWKQLTFTQTEEYIKNLDEFFSNQLGFLFRTLRTTTTNNLPKKVYRVRKKESGINANLISEFSSPPAGLCRTIQRANLPFHPVFYGAPSPHTALLETLAYTYKKDEENVFFLSEWEFKADQPTYVTPFMFGAYDKVPLFNEFSKKPLEEITAQIADLTTDEKEALNQIFRFFSELFEYEDTHAISGYLGHIHLYAPGNIRTDVFIYPSIRTGNASMNFAIHPNAVIHKMQLKRIFVVGVDDYSVDKANGSATFKFTIQDYLGINNDHGYLIWRNLPQEDWDDFTAMFPIENGEQ